MNSNYISTSALYAPHLSHSGIKGMKWGIRRYQNPDGTLTEEGKRRYGYNLDLNDRSRRNIAKIRYGEARRRYEYAKLNNPKNTYRLAELKRRERNAKRSERVVKRFDKGSQLAAKGRTITGNRVRSSVAVSTAYVGASVVSSLLKHRISKIAPGDSRYETVGNMLSNLGSIALYGGAIAYSTKQAMNNRNLRSYYSSLASGSNTIKRVGSQEYADRIRKRGI